MPEVGSHAEPVPQSAFCVHLQRPLLHTLVPELPLQSALVAQVPKHTPMLLAAGVKGLQVRPSGQVAEAVDSWHTARHRPCVGTVAEAG